MLNQSKTFNFTQVLASGGTKLEIYFKVVVTKTQRNLAEKKN